MGNVWYVTPETDKLELEYRGHSFWLQVKRDLNMGEKRRLELAGFRAMSSPGSRAEERETKVDIDWRAMSFARVEAYLVDWSLSDDRGAKLSLANKRDAIEQLDPAVFDVIETAISKHVEARDAAKKAQAGAPEPSGTSA